MIISGFGLQCYVFIRGQGNIRRIFGNTKPVYFIRIQVTKTLKSASIFYTFWTITTTAVIWFIVGTKARPFHERGNPREMQYDHRNKQYGRQAAQLRNDFDGKLADHVSDLASR